MGYRVASLVILSIFLASFVSAVEYCSTYDDFSEGSLDAGKWEIRQDVEGQPFMGEYGVDDGLENFHTQQNTIGDKRVYLFPKRQFTTGDVLEYDFNLISKEGNHLQMVLLTGNQYIRIGIAGYSNAVQGSDELGMYHIKIEFEENNLHIERISPSNVSLVDDLPLTNANGDYELYIGAVSGHNGRVHMDFDNFELCTEEDVPVVPEFSFYAGILTVAGALVGFFLIRRR
jgi:hypothetical protein